MKRGIVPGPDTRALDPSPSSTDVNPGVATDGANSTGQMNEDTSLKASAIFSSVGTRCRRTRFPPEHES